MAMKCTWTIVHFICSVTLPEVKKIFATGDVHHNLLVNIHYWQKKNKWQKRNTVTVMQCLTQSTGLLLYMVA